MQDAQNSVIKLEPHNIEAEQQLLGALLIHNDSLGRIQGLVDAETFFDPVHKVIFQRIKSRIDNGQLASPITLRVELDDHAGLKDLGGPRYLANLAGAAISAAALTHYASMLADLKAKRDMLAVMRDGVQSIRDGREGAAAVASRIETGVGKVASVASTKPLVIHFAQAAFSAIENINGAYQGDKPAGISTGIAQLDRQVGLLRAGNLIILAGRPSMGKTTVAQNFAYDAAINGKGVYYGSLEMLGEELAPRFFSKGLAAKGIKIPYSNMLAGRLSEDEMRQVVMEAKEQAERLPIMVGEREVREVTKFRASVRRAQQRFADTDTPLGLIVIDYVQLMASNTARSVYERASEASDAAKSLAMEFGVPVIALAQLSREVERRDPPIPMLADLRETGKLEEDADVVMFCYRDAYYLQRKLDAVKGKNIDEEADLRAMLDQCRNQIDIIVSKQRSGAIGTVQAYVDMATCHMTADQSGYDERLI